MRTNKSALSTEPGGTAVSDTITRIMDAALNEFATFGIGGARIERIALHAGFTKQLIYYYFQTKDALYEAVLDRVSQQMTSEILSREHSESSALEQIEDMLNAIFHQYRANPYLANITMDQSIHQCAHVKSKGNLRQTCPQIVDRFTRLIGLGVQEGEIRPGIDAPHFFALAMSVLTGCFFTGRTMSIFVDADLTSNEGYEKWRRGAMDFVLAALRGNDASA